MKNPTGRQGILLFLLIAILVLSCNYPLALTESYYPPVQAEYLITASVPPFTLPTPAPEATFEAEGILLSGSQPSGILPPPPQSNPVADTPILYYTQGGDTLPALAVRFGVDPAEIASAAPVPPVGLVNPDQLLIIPDRLESTTPGQRLLPDSEFVYSPTAIDFDIQEFVAQAGGYLSTYSEYLASTGMTTGADIVQRVAIENSVNPRLLLALLEYQSHWVYGGAADLNLAQ
ncbi:MAG TPA: LysM peptidoglycan-binding domain-containing protein, partial [Anaerolineales bacterium]|nr:LysM peptidoglycan-binding domain-containing protein [Anaerolineales bacterium]